MPESTYADLVSAPTLWEEGHLPAGRVTRLVVSCSVVVAAFDLLVTGRLSILFDVVFVLLCGAAALLVRPKDFFGVGVLPPLLLLGLITVLTVLHRGWIADPRDNPVQAVVSGLTGHATGLTTGYALALLFLAIRHRYLATHRGSQAQSQARPAPTPHSNRAGSPAPTRTTSATPSERSTTVVGSEPHSPESMTASRS